MPLRRWPPRMRNGGLPFRRRFNDGTHFAQRVGHAIHRATVTAIRRRQSSTSKSCAREQPTQQAHGGAGITQVAALRRLEAVQTDPVHGHSAGVRPFDNHPHIAKAL